MIKVALLLLVSACLCVAADLRAKNVILFVGDAGGIPTLNAASLFRHGAPQKLFIQRMPHLALSDTSAADSWVTDSAAGMSAIVTGQKTNNGVISQSAAAVRGKQDGQILQTILDHAEQRGLSTGVVSNMPITDATAAACYAHANERSAAGAIFAQVLRPRFGDGVDLLIGAGREAVRTETAKLGIDIEPALREQSYVLRNSIDLIAPKDDRVVTLYDTSDFELWPAVEKALSALGRNPKGFFLMVEWDTHTDHLRRGLNRVAELDDAIRRTAEIMAGDTLIIFAADHSFDLRLRGGSPGQPLVSDLVETRIAGAGWKAPIRVENAHTGEEVLIAATGPGAERVHGFIPNTQLFEIMMVAYGWK